MLSKIERFWEDTKNEGLGYSMRVNTLTIKTDSLTMKRERIKENANKSGHTKVVP
jgi:hypothetical protein